MRFHALFRFSLFPLMALAASAGPLGELMPVPVAVEARAGFAEAAACTKVSVRVAAVPGAPSATADEAYVLDVAPDGVSIVAPTARGERWARVTLDQLQRLSGDRVPCCRITDWPHFKWRGFMHDSGRNFLEVEHVKGIIDAMSRCKMNLFHWHFTEYYGWRLESKRFPELQRPDAFYLRYIGKYYTQDEFREVVDYAATRGVTVMPEFDIPGHAFAFRRAFGFETMRDDGVREKLCALVDELCSLVPREKMPFIHLGTDEARLPEEKVPPLWMAPIIARVHANGRTVVGWTPGELAGLTEGGGVVGMRWGRPKAVDTTGVIPFLDASQMYLDTLDPFEIPAVATYRRVCPWNESEGERLGAVTCAWHDDFAGTGFRTLVNQAILPAFVLFGDAYWRGRDEEPAGAGGGRIVPRGGDPRLEKLADIERRTAAQRDRVWIDSPYPFHFLRQSDMRWRVSLADGTLLATNVAQATVFLWQNALAGMEDGKVKSLGGNLTTNRMGTAILETWIHAPSNIACGAWIGFTDFTRDHGRARSAPTPDVGQWNRFGATVEINGEQVPPPKWRKPGQQSGADVPHLKYVHELDEIAFEDEEYYMREPTPIKLVKGWNHVKLTVPMRKKAGNHAPWVGTFIPLLGTTAHPREVPGLAYSAQKPVVPPMDAQDEGWPNIDPARRVVPPGKVLWQADFSKVSKDLSDAFVFEKEDGAEGFAEIVEGKLRIVKTNDRGYLVFRPKAPFAVPAQTPLQAFAYVSGRTNDPEYAIGFLRLYGKQRSFKYVSELNERRNGGPRMDFLFNTPPGAQERKLCRFLANKANGTDITPAIVVAGPRSDSFWSGWGVEDLKVARAKWEAFLKKVEPPDHSGDRQDEAAFDAALAADIDHAAKVVRRGNASVLLVDGVETPPIFFKGKIQRDAAKNLYCGRRMEENGVKMQVVTVRFGDAPKMHGWWSAKGFDVQGAVREIKDAMRMAPNSLFVLTAILDAYPEFTAEHPGETWIAEGGCTVWGNQTHADYDLNPKKKREGYWPWVSYSSVVWREAVRTNLVTLVDALKAAGLSKRIVGIHLGAFHDHQFATRRLDFSRPAIEGFMRWQKRVFGKVRWEGAPTFDPDLDYFTPGRDDHQIAYFRYLKHQPFELQEDLVRTVKARFGKDLIGVRWCMAPFGGIYGGAYDIAPFAQSDAIDVIAPQADYSRRTPGAAIGLRLPCASFREHGKLMLCEFDFRTYAAVSGREAELTVIGDSQAADDAMWRSTYRKCAGQMMAARMGWWFYDMAGGWFEPPPIAADIADSVRTMRRLAAAPQESVASAAFVVDESGALLRNLPSHWYNHDEERLFATQLQLLAGSGVPTDFWLAEDFIRKPELAKRYRVIVFGGLYHIDASRRRLLDALKGEGRTLVFLSGTGVVGGGEATGFDIVHERAPKNHRVVAEPGVKENMISFTDHHLLTKFLGNDNLGRGWRPRRDTVKEGAGVKVMARFSPDGEPAVAERASGKGRDAWKSVMIGSAAGLTPQYFNALVRAAGGYVPAPYGLQVDMNGSFVSVHAIIPGRYAFRLPRPCRVTNLKTGREVDAPGGVLALDLTAGETRWYGLDVPQDGSANVTTREILSWKGAGLAAWNRVSQARDLACSDSGVTFVTTGSDSQLYCGKCDFVSSASQFLRFRVRSTAGGKVEVFWAAADDPNLSQKKSASFEMIGDGAWHDYELRPFWPSGKRIVKLRFDPPQTAPKGTKVDISAIAILENPDGAGPIDTAKFPGVMFRYATSEKRYSTLVWTTDASETMCRHEFRPVPDGKEHVYWFDLSLGVNGGIGYWYKKEWKGTASWFGVMDMRRGKALDVKDLRFVSEPPHLPADVEVGSALPADGIVRVGYRSGIEFVLRNLGTIPARNVVFELDSASSGLAFADKTFPLGCVPASIGYDSVGGRLPNELVTTVPFEAKCVGRQVVRGKISYASESDGVASVRAVPVECVVEVLPSLGLPKADYVPEPKPIATRCEVGAISFPGWRRHSWDRIRNFTPERKPLLGWYDEGNPEAVDWQIKWLVENGISYLLVDWYPRKEYVTGRFYISSSHWFEAFRKARYRRFLKFAVLWENEMKGHDVAFVEWIARYLADEFFSMPEYYRIDGRPVVYVWNKTRLDTELSAAGGCRKALEIIEAAAKAKGHKGVWFIAHRSPAVSRDEIESIRAAGFDMTAIYRYRGEGEPGVSSLVEGRRPFSEVAKTSLQHWRALQKIGILPFLPSLTTGWDDRPWNGDHGFEIYGRTVASFEAICRDALAFSAESGVKNMLVGPINEWGEGSYIEPNAEFGFGMYEAIRNTFGIKPAEGWPVNFTPKDVGLGPYPALPIPKVEDSNAKIWYNLRHENG